MSDEIDELNIEDVMKFMYITWMTVTTIFIGIVVGSCVLNYFGELNVDTTIQFICFNFMMCYFWMTFTLWGYKDKLKEFFELEEGNNNE